MAAYHNRLKEGVEPSKAWDQSKDEMDAGARYGTWKKDFFLSKLDDSGRFCHAMEIRSVLLLRPWHHAQTDSGYALVAGIYVALTTCGSLSPPSPTV